MDSRVYRIYSLATILPPGICISQYLHHIVNHPCKNIMRWKTCRSNVILVIIYIEEYMLNHMSGSLDGALIVCV